MNYTPKRKLIAVDLFGGGGGACIGMQNAGFEVIGIDIKPHPNYPAEMLIADISTGQLPVDLRKVDFVWASPPCQLFSVSSRFGKNDWKRHPNLIPITREILKGHPFSVIENVVGSPIRPDVVLMGSSVGLGRLDRRRHFETSFFMMYPPPKKQPRWKWEKGIAGTITKSLCASSHFYNRKANGLPGRIPNWEAKEIMGIPSEYEMTNDEIGEAVAPPMAEFITKEARRQILYDT